MTYCPKLGVYTISQKACVKGSDFIVKLFGCACGHADLNAVSCQMPETALGSEGWREVGIRALTRKMACMGGDEYRDEVS